MPERVNLNSSLRAILRVAKSPASQTGDPPAKKILLHTSVAFAPVTGLILGPDPTLTGLVHIKLGSVGWDFSPDSCNVTLEDPAHAILFQ
jgi:hypothetical protein